MDHPNIQPKCEITNGPTLAQYWQWCCWDLAPVYGQTGPLPKWYLRAALGRQGLATFICPSLGASILANYDRPSNKPLLGWNLAFLLPTWVVGVIPTLGPVECHCWAKRQRKLGKFEMWMYGASTETTLGRFERWYWPSNIGRLLADKTNPVLGRVFCSGNSHLWEALLRAFKVIFKIFNWTSQFVLTW